MKAVDKRPAVWRVEPGTVRALLPANVLVEPSDLVPQDHPPPGRRVRKEQAVRTERSEEHTSELQSRLHLVCRLLLEKKKNRQYRAIRRAITTLPQPQPAQNTSCTKPLPSPQPVYVPQPQMFATHTSYCLSVRYAVVP